MTTILYLVAAALILNALCMATLLVFVLAVFHRCKAVTFNWPAWYWPWKKPKKFWA